MKKIFLLFLLAPFLTTAQGLRLFTILPTQDWEAFRQSDTAISYPDVFLRLYTEGQIFTALSQTNISSTLGYLGKAKDPEGNFIHLFQHTKRTSTEYEPKGLTVLEVSSQNIEKNRVYIPYSDISSKIHFEATFACAEIRLCNVVQDVTTQYYLPHAQKMLQPKMKRATELGHTVVEYGKKGLLAVEVAGVIMLGGGVHYYYLTQADVDIEEQEEAEAKAATAK